MKNKFLQISIGISIIMLSAGFLIRSISPSQATPGPEKFLAEGVSKIGKFQMSFTYAVFPDGTAVQRALVWDTETGKSVYYRNDDAGWVKQDNQLPANPLGI
jgi:hypothetical protein